MEVVAGTRTMHGFDSKRARRDAPADLARTRRAMLVLGSERTPFAIPCPGKPCDDAAAMRLFDFLPSGNGYKVRLALRWLGIPFDYHEVDILKGESRTPSFLAKNPFGQIPVLELDDGTCLRESSAILVYLAEGTPLLPDDKLLRTRALEWMAFEQTHVDGVISRARFRRLYPEVIPTRAEEFDAWHAEGTEALRVLDDHLRTRTYLVDERFTIADIALFAYTHCADEGGFDLAAYDALRVWFARVRGQRGHLPIDVTPRREAP